MLPHEFIQKIFAESGVLTPPRILPYGYQVSTYLTIGIDHLTSPDDGTFVLLPQVIELFDAARQIYGGPISVNAGFRTHNHELTLQARGYKTAKFVSPHSLGAALDCKAIPLPGKPDYDGEETNRQLQSAFREAAQQLSFPAPRLGHKAYGEAFTHVDLVFLLFAPFTNLAHPETWPELSDDQRLLISAWRPGIEW